MTRLRSAAGFEYHATDVLEGTLGFTLRATQRELVAVLDRPVAYAGRLGDRAHLDLLFATARVERDRDAGLLGGALHAVPATCSGAFTRDTAASKQRIDPILEKLQPGVVLGVPRRLVTDLHAAGVNAGRNALEYLFIVSEADPDIECTGAVDSPSASHVRSPSLQASSLGRGDPAGELSSSPV